MTFVFLLGLVIGIAIGAACALGLVFLSVCLGVAGGLNW